MNRFFVSNERGWRLARTIVQGIIGVIIANIDVIIGAFDIPMEAKIIIVPLVMAILSPIMEAIGTTDMDKSEVPEGYFEDMEEDTEEGDEDADSE